MFQKLKASIVAHGTKYLGALTTLLGAVQTAIVTGLLEVDKGYKNAVALAVIALGAATIKRGFTNTRNAAAPTVPPA